MNDNYKINSIFRTIQGEGYNQGKSAIFIRFSGCNLWDGNLVKRNLSINCGRWCDTDFSYRYSIDLEHIFKYIDREPTTSLIVLTGGEPYLQITQEFIDALNNKYNRIVCIETNGTVDKSFKNCWITVAPKEHTVLIVKKGNELKVVAPQDINYQELLSYEFDHFYIQPKDNIDNCLNILYLLDSYPKYTLTIQLHKLLNLE
jgi:7-carboxy-7-deazaguanine synthase